MFLNESSDDALNNGRCSGAPAYACSVGLIGYKFTTIAASIHCPFSIQHDNYTKCSYSLPQLLLPLTSHLSLSR